MADSFDIIDYLIYLRRRAGIIVAAIVVAGLAAAGISAALPAKYEARVSLLIDPRAAADSGELPLMSPAYLDSLDTYSHFALSDELFERAAEELQLNKLASAEPRDVLRVSRAARILEIRAELDDPDDAIRLARYVAGQTVALSRRIDHELAKGTQRGLPERLMVVDRGRKPRQPSRPNLTANVAVAVAFALLFSALYVTASYGWSAARTVRSSDE